MQGRCRPLERTPRGSTRAVPLTARSAGLLGGVFCWDSCSFPRPETRPRVNRPGSFSLTMSALLYKTWACPHARRAPRGGARPCRVFDHVTIKRCRQTDTAGVYGPSRIVCSAAAAPAVRTEQDVPGMSAYLDSLKWDQNGLVAVIAQV